MCVCVSQAYRSVFGRKRNTSGDILSFLIFPDKLLVSSHTRFTYNSILKFEGREGGGKKGSKQGRERKGEK